MMDTNSDPSFLRVAIVGGGCSGTLVAVQLLLKAASNVHVVLIERSAELGRGVAYSTLCPGHLLNVPAARMSAFPDDPEHFLRWAQSKAGQPRYPGAVGPEDFLERRLFGDYLKEVLEHALGKNTPSVSFEHVLGEAISIEEFAGRPRIVMSNGQTIVADRVVLAVGILPGEYPIRRPLAFYRCSRYVHTPFNKDVLKGVGESDGLLLVGAGLTAVDIAVSCYRQGHKGIVHALSRRGIRPKEHLAKPAKKHPPFLSPGQLPRTVRATLRLVRSEVAKGNEWRAVIDSMRPVTQQLWLGYSLEDRARFMRHLRPFWEAHRHRISPESASALMEMEASGRLRFHSGRLVSLRETASGVAALIRCRGGERYAPLNVAKVINCTGPRTDYSKYQHPLLVNLLASGLIQHDPLALGIDAFPSGEVRRFGGMPSGWLYTIGAPLKGALWESTAVAEIRVQAVEIAGRLVAPKTVTLGSHGA